MNGLRGDAVHVLAPRTCEGGGTSAHTGTGGSSSPAYHSQKSTKNKNCKHRKIMLFYALLPEIRTPPVPVCATLTTPFVNAGGKASNRPRTLTTRQIPICQCTFERTKSLNRKYSLADSQKIATGKIPAGWNSRSNLRVFFPIIRRREDPEQP